MLAGGIRGHVQATLESPAQLETNHVSEVRSQPVNEEREVSVHRESRPPKKEEKADEIYFTGYGDIGGKMRVWLSDGSSYSGNDIQFCSPQYVIIRGRVIKKQPERAEEGVHSRSL